MTRNRTRRPRLALVILAALLVATDARVAIAGGTPTERALLGEAAVFAEKTRGTGPVYVDENSVTSVASPVGDFVVARAHDFRGWFHLVARTGPRPFVAFLQTDAGALTGALASVSVATGDVGEAVPFSIPVTSPSTASAPGDDVLAEEETRCQLGLGTLGMLADCRLLGDCDTTPGPAGGVAFLVGALGCKSSASRGLTWWTTGDNIDYQEQTMYGSWNISPRWTEVADFEYRSQGCAPPDTIQAYNDRWPGTNRDLDYSRCYDFRADGPRARRVIYTLEIHWSDGAVQEVRYERDETFVADLFYHDHNLGPGHALQWIEMTESLGGNQFISQYRFGRAFRDWHRYHCTETASC